MANAPTMKLSKKSAPAEAAAATEQVTEQAAETATASTNDQIDGASIVKNDDLIQSTVHTIENTKEEKAFKAVPELLNDIDHNYFKIGGYLALIQNNGWFMDKGYETFKAYVEAECGDIAYRKAIYLIQIYNGLVASGVQWDDVKHLGWTKLKELAPILTTDNVGELAAAAAEMTVLQLQEHIKQMTAAPKGDGEEGPGDDDTAKTVTTVTFKVHTDQKETIREALDKAKHEVGTDVDTVALEAICLSFLGAAPKIKVQSLTEMMKGKSAEEVLNAFGEVFPDVEISATLP